MIQPRSCPRCPGGVLAHHNSPHGRNLRGQHCTDCGWRTDIDGPALIKAINDLKADLVDGAA